MISIGNALDRDLSAVHPMAVCELFYARIQPL
jgi:hypothetical protein